MQEARLRLEEDEDSGDGSSEEPEEEANVQQARGAVPSKSAAVKREET